MLLSFVDKNPGMTRALVSDALVSEDEHLPERTAQCLDRVEASFKQSPRMTVTRGA